MKTKKGEKEKLRSVILEKAIAYLKKHGQGGSGTEHIMKYMGLTRGALYSHFHSKADLFAQAVCYDLAKLEDSLLMRFQRDGDDAIKKIIEDHLSESSLYNVETSCAFTSLSTDMQRSDEEYRSQYEKYMDRIYALFARALKDQFPNDTEFQSHEKALNLYSGLVGTLTMARTMSDPKKAKEILESGKKFLISQFMKN
ncbi:TetR/AcrR family transcriptional regulator [Hydrogenovibrio marinus]|uniref:HTH tetR-type domain-containing protein n=1 Tax=Hydrogenovibrio marinus TaxID=28885 RepID=A0A066ZQY1_HYDMR|nr:TetR/AcrR family transcriptional regulator [Hydrogenovibrio marinus]KDN96178.1 hypothetical protein EI16_07785 [Hydrogenovibrio marinus]MBN2607280.1 TetR/AcrR family transcriptional regulator [Thiotrichales bacterium]BBN60644.1 hypothetical protein HVMH_2238 [Hydrogenovibrio marinus]